MTIQGFYPHFGLKFRVNDRNRGCGGTVYIDRVQERFEEVCKAQGVAVQSKPILKSPGTHYQGCHEIVFYTGPDANRSPKELEARRIVCDDPATVWQNDEFTALMNTGLLKTDLLNASGSSCPCGGIPPGTKS